MVPKFAYCFEAPPGGLYPAILNAREMTAYEPLAISGRGGVVEVLPLDQQHGNIVSLGFRFGDFTYSTDVSDFPPQTVERLAGTKVWVVDALRRRPHKTHFNVETALSWIERIGPERAYLTNMHHDLDYAALKASLPPHVEPAYDGLAFDIPDGL
jgi:phosphoribosyl 1,2-cyclic phosphate phosphodiesterase